MTHVYFVRLTNKRIVYHEYQNTDKTRSCWPLHCWRNLHNWLRKEPRRHISGRNGRRCRSSERGCRVSSHSNKHSQANALLFQQRVFIVPKDSPMGAVITNSRGCAVFRPVSQSSQPAAYEHPQLLFRERFRQTLDSSACFHPPRRAC